MHDFRGVTAGLILCPRIISSLLTESVIKTRGLERIKKQTCHWICEICFPKAVGVKLC